MGKAIEDTDGDKILASPVGEGERSGIAIWYFSDHGGDEHLQISGLSMSVVPDSVLPQIDRWVKVYTEGSAEQGLPPVLGRFELVQNRINFYPLYGLQQGLTYKILLSTELGQILNESVKNPILGFEFHIPERKGVSSTTVSAIYPSSDQLPENLLKFYIHFSHPMSVGNVYDYIHLLDEAGNEVELPFLELGEELWDYDSQRLTLLFDPGRIKSGLVPNLEEGLALQAGRSYTLKIDSSWEDAEGQPLVNGFEKSFAVVAGDTVSPNPYNWEKVWPGVNSREPVVLRFPESLDEALLQRVIVVRNRSGQEIRGSVQVKDQETRWEFFPDEIWPPGTYRIEIQTILEDLAGNSIARPFEVEQRRSGEYRDGPRYVYLDFQL